MINTLFLIVAYLLDAAFALPLLIIQSIRNRKRLSSYHFNVAKHYDYKWASMFFYGEDGHTVSALCYKRGVIENRTRYVLFVKIIDYVFQDEKHCEESYINEYLTKL